MNETFDEKDENRIIVFGLILIFGNDLKDRNTIEREEEIGQNFQHYLGLGRWIMKLIFYHKNDIM